jgi:hypothetical protein
MSDELPLQNPTPMTPEQVAAQRKPLHDLIKQNLPKVG